MNPYGKVAQAAISAMSCLAEHYTGEDSPRLNSRSVAELRQLSQAIVAKVLTTLSQVGLVTGAPGPGGGYSLAKEPKEITLHEIVSQFDRLEETLMCPFGPGWCGTGPQCPLHEELEELREKIATFLQQTTLERFRP